MPFSDMAVWLKKARQASGLTQKKFAESVGYSRSAISMMETDKQAIPDSVIAKARQLVRNLPELPARGEADPNAGLPLFPVAFSKAEIPLYPAVPAGEWSEPLDTEDLVEVEAKFIGNGRFACRVRGDSMLPMLEPDDLAIFQKHEDPPIGTIIIARNGDGGATVKQLRHNGADFTLHSLNNRYQDATASQWEAVGFLVGIERNIGGTVITYYNPRGLRPSA